MKNKSVWYTALLLFLFCTTAFTVSAEIVNGIACKVGGEIITVHEFEEAYAQRKEQSARYGGPSPTRREVMNALVDKMLLQSEAQRKGVVVSEEELDAIVEDIKTQNKLTQEALERELARDNITIQDLKDRYREEILTSRLINQFISERGETVSDESIRSFYNDPQNRRLITVPGTVNLSVIFVPASGDLTYQESVELKKRALEAYRRAKEGEKFADLVAEYSGAEAASPTGGYIGSFTKEQLLTMMPADSVAALFSLDEDEIATPVRLKDGYRIFRVEGKKEQKLLTLEESYENIKSYLLKIKGDELLDSFLAEIKETTAIQYLVELG